MWKKQEMEEETDREKKERFRLTETWIISLGGTRLFS